VVLFGKILSNECDEEFRFIQLHIKETIVAQLRGLLKERHPYKTEVEVGKVVSQI
jgi:ligand-binding sensor domain-containing protein